MDNTAGRRSWPGGHVITDSGSNDDGSWVRFGNGLRRCAGEQKLSSGEGAGLKAETSII